MLERSVPEGAEVDARYLGRRDDRAKRPHERTVHPHQLLRLDLICLVQDHAHLGLMRLEYLDDGAELIGDIELMWVEEEEHAVRVLRKPLDHLMEIVAASLLLLARLYTWAVDQRDAPHDGRRDRGGLQPVEEVRAVVAQRVERRVRLRRERVARRHLLAVAVHDDNEPIRGWLRPDVLVWKVAAEEVANERGLSDRILPEEQHHRPRVEPRVAQHRLTQLVVGRLLLERPELVHVQALEPLEDGRIRHRKHRRSKARQRLRGRPRHREQHQQQPKWTHMACLSLARPREMTRRNTAQHGAASAGRQLLGLFRRGLPKLKSSTLTASKDSSAPLVQHKY